MKYECWNTCCNSYAGYGLRVRASKGAMACPECGHEGLRPACDLPRWPAALPGAILFGVFGLLALGPLAALVCVFIGACIGLYVKMVP